MGNHPAAMLVETLFIEGSGSEALLGAGAVVGASLRESGLASDGIPAGEHEVCALLERNGHGDNGIAVLFSECQTRGVSQSRRLHWVTFAGIDDALAVSSPSTELTICMHSCAA